MFRSLKAGSYVVESLYLVDESCSLCPNAKMLRTDLSGRVWVRVLGKVESDKPEQNLRTSVCAAWQHDVWTFAVGCSRSYIVTPVDIPLNHL